MNLKKVVLYGFKSFADKTTIPFEYNMTAIVGPNGSGKSNVADAIRWVLGEKSAKQLRGKNMQDVIFMGTAARKSLSFCEVELYFDNTNHIFPIEFDEVVISRRLDRSGNSEYFINKEKMRLKDITNLLHDTGVGTEGYTLIGQDKVKDIMSSKPEDRRIIFEDAAGVSKFKAQKAETVRKLERSSDNLSRCNDLINEIENRLGPLKKQAEDAMKYRELTTELKYNEVNYYIYRFENNKSLVDGIKDKLTAIILDLNNAEQSAQKAQDDYDMLTASIGTLDDKLADCNQRLTSLKVSAERASGTEQLHEQRILHYTDELKRLSDEKASLEKSMGEKADALAASLAEKEQKTAELSRVSETLEADTLKLQQILAKISADETSIEDSNRRMVSAAEELAAIKGNMSALVKEKELNEKLLESKNQNLLVKKNALDAEYTDLAINEANLKKTMDKGKALADEYNENVGEYNDKKHSLETLAEDLVKLSSRISSLETKHTLLVKMKEDYDGFGLAVKRLMQDAKSDLDLQRRVCGVVAEIIKAPVGMELAVETALGNAVQNVVTKNEEDAKHVISYLQNKRYGQITFLPMTSFKPRTLEPEFRSSLSERGCYGIASDIVKYDSKFDGIVKGLLGKTVVVDNMDTAVRMAKNYRYGFKIVTMDGNQIATSGAIRGGSAKSEGGIFSKEKEIAEAKVSWDKAKKQYEQLIVMRADYERAMHKADDETARLKSEMEELKIAGGVLKEKIAKSKQNIDFMEEEVHLMASEIETLKKGVKETADKLGSVDKLEAEISSQKIMSGDLAEKSKAQTDLNKKERDELNSKVISLRVRVAELKTEIENAEADSFRLKREKDVLNEQILDDKAKMLSLESEVNAERLRAKTAVMSREDREQIETLTQYITELTDQKRNSQSELSRINSLRIQLGDTVKDLEVQRYKQEAALEKADSDIKYLEDHVWQEYSLTYQNALELKDENFDFEKANSNINKLKRAINQLGDVNQLAIRDYEENGKRYEELCAQRDDVQNAVDDLNKILKDLTDEMTTRFNDAFVKINENFKVTFKELFGGGNAELLLLDSTTGDPLDAGVDIKIQPPGKNTRTLSLFSGGEQSLTAIAILFAILKLKAMPFCLLDEVEAALDDSNVTLFAEYVKKLSKDTQFIVITHRKPTMELADSLDGVTMEEMGISKILSVKLADALLTAEEK